MRALLYFTITAMFWGLNFHLAKVMLKEASFIEAGFWRYLFAVVPLFLLALGGLPSKKELLDSFKGVFLIGVVGLFGFNIFFFWGLMHSSAINGALIIAITPVLTMLFSKIILGSPFERIQMLGAFLSLIGVFYLILKGDWTQINNIEFNKGDLMLLLSSSLFSIQNVWVKIYSGKLSNKNFTLLTNLFCFLGFVLILPFLVDLEGITGHSGIFWLSALGIGLIGTSVAYYLWNAGIQLSSANQAGIFINVVPLSTALFSIAFGEELFGYHLISGAIILLGVFIIRKA